MLCMRKLALLIILIIIVGAVKDFDSSDESYQIPSSDSSDFNGSLKSSGTSKKRKRIDSDDQINDTTFKVKKKSPWKKKIGRQTNETKMNKKIVELLGTKGNNIKNHEQAQKAAQEHFDKVRLRRNEYDREKYKINPRRGDIRYSAGYQSKEQKIERSIKTFQKKDPGLSDSEARKLAQEHYFAEHERRMEYLQAYRARKKKKRN